MAKKWCMFNCKGCKSRIAIECDGSFGYGDSLTCPVCEEEEKAHYEITFPFFTEINQYDEFKKSKATTV